MIGTRRHFSLLSYAWLVAALSLAALVLLGVLLWGPWERHGIASGRPLRFYCAAGMTKAVEEIIKDYEKAYGVRVQATYDGSGKLLSTIRTGQGQGDLYLAADASHMNEARKLGLVAEVI